MNKLVLVLAGLLVGFGVSNFGLQPGAVKKARLDGRMSACKEIFTVIAPMFPIPLGCVEFNGDAAISSPLVPEVVMSLDGKKLQ